ncbi:MAG: FIST N-terminal domain-containing protein [Gemmatimonas sp.]
MSQHPVVIRKGVSQSTDPRIAVRELYEALEQPDMKLAVFFCDPAYDRDLLTEAFRATFGDAPLIGCTSAGEITPVGYLSGTLTGFSIGGAGCQAVVSSVHLDTFDRAHASNCVGASLDALEARSGQPATPENTFAFMLIDGLAMQEEMVVSCVHQQLRGIDVIGGSAADGVSFGKTFQYFDGHFHQNTAILSLVYLDVPFMAFRTQHFVKSETRMVVTKSDPARRIVHEINGLPAGREFARLLGLSVTELTPLIFASYPVVVRIGGQYLVRSIAMVNEDESLRFFCAIDDGVVLTVGAGVDMVDNLRQAFEDVRARIGPPQLVLGCDCILRRLETERDGIKEAIGSIFAENNVVGFATYGEQFNAMHVNQTFTGLAIGMPKAA